MRLTYLVEDIYTDGLFSYLRKDTLHAYLKYFRLKKYCKFVFQCNACCNVESLRNIHFNVECLGNMYCNIETSSSIYFNAECLGNVCCNISRQHRAMYAHY